MTDSEFRLPDRQPMFAAVGEGIQAFSLVEWELVMLFAAMIDSPKLGVGAAILDGARHMETRLRVVEAVLPLSLDGEQAAEAKNLLNRIR